jgi:hypothetical protein
MSQRTAIHSGDITNEKSLDLVASTATPSVMAMPIVNPDGSNISGAGGTINTFETTGLVPKVYDYISLTYTGSNITGVVYKTGGAAGTTAATLTLGYTGSILTTVTRT